MRRYLVFGNIETGTWQKHVKTKYSNVRNKTNEHGVANTRPLDNSQYTDINILIVIDLLQNLELMD